MVNLCKQKIKPVYSFRVQLSTTVNDDTVTSTRAHANTEKAVNVCLKFRGLGNVLM